MMKANGKDVQVSAATSRVPAPERRNLVADGEDSEMMDSVRPALQRSCPSTASNALPYQYCTKNTGHPLLICWARVCIQGLSAPVWTNFSQRGEVRTVKVEKKEYFVYL